MQREEIQHNTAAQVKGYLDEALRVVAELEIDDELKVPAFVKAVDLLAAKQVMMTPTAAAAADLSLLRRSNHDLRG